MDIETQKKELIKIINLSKNRVDLFFDALQPINSKRNTNIFIYLRALKLLNLDEFSSLKEEIENSIKTGIEYLSKKTKDI
ncbi:hypothetical protein GW891_03785 [bacterium]|nr:hypothetical protein [bacterium]